MDFSFLSVSSGTIKGEYRGIEFTYRVPTAKEEDEFQSIQFRQVTDGRSLSDVAMNRGSGKSSNPDKIISFSALPLRRFEQLCTGWTPSFKLNGEDVNFSQDNVKKLVEDLPKLAQQVDNILWAKYNETLEEEQGN